MDAAQITSITDVKTLHGIVAEKRAAAIMSLLATAKANGRDPHAWLTDVLTRLPTTRDRDIGDLLPHLWQPR